MAEELKALSGYGLRTQEAILNTIAEYCSPIEIDGKVFMIPEEVNSLIDNLVEQLEESRGMSITIGRELGREKC